MFLIADPAGAARLRFISAFAVVFAAAAVATVSPTEHGDAGGTRVVVLIGGKRSYRDAGIALRSALSDKAYRGILVGLPGAQIVRAVLLGSEDPGSSNSRPVVGHPVSGPIT